MASSAFADILKTHTKHRKNAGFLRFGPKPARGEIEPGPFLAEASLHFSILKLLQQDCGFELQIRKHCKNAGKTPFFRPRALKKTPS